MHFGLPKVITMATRTIRETVRFHRPFGLLGVDGPLPAGHYEIETEEERMDGLTFPVWQRVATTLHLTGIARGYGFALRMEPEILDAIITADKATPAPSTQCDDIRPRNKPGWVGFVTPPMIIPIALGMAAIAAVILGPFT